MPVEGLWLQLGRFGVYSRLIPNDNMERKTDRRTVLIVDEDRRLVRLIEKALELEGFTVSSAQSAGEARSWLEQNQADLMLLDSKLEDETTPDMVAQLTAARLCPPFVIITGQGDERMAVEMMKRGARDYLVKGVDFLQFVPAVVRHVLEQVDKERRLAEAEEQVHLVRSAVEQGFNAVLITGPELPDPKVIYINPAFSQATGYSREKVVGRPLSTLANLSQVLERLRVGLPEGMPYLDEISTFQTPQGERWGEWRVGPVKDKTGRNTHWLITFNDITERKRLEKEILEISDQERRRLGQDLHDGLCQHLAGIELMSQVLEKKLAARSRANAAQAGEIARHVREAIAQTRSLARGLSPVALEYDGLPTALQELAANTAKLFGIRCRVECSQPVQCQVPAVATHLYRIAQEAISNAVRHGRASEIVIHLESGGDRTTLSVVDNGVGFPSELPRQRGMGLRIMQYRAGMIGGSFSISKGPAGGTQVICAIPTSFREISGQPPTTSSGQA